MTLHTAQADIIIAGFPDWVGKQPARGRYDYGDTCGCAFAQYLKAIGFRAVAVGGQCFFAVGVSGRFSPHLTDALELTPHTFGALARRLA